MKLITEKYRDSRKGMLLEKSCIVVCVLEIAIEGSVRDASLRIRFIKYLAPSLVSEINLLNILARCW